MQGILISGGTHSSDNQLDFTTPSTFATSIQSNGAYSNGIIFIEDGEGSNDRLIAAYSDAGNSSHSGWNSNMTAEEKTMQKGLFWSGPICIDNMQSGASVGDQFASRAFACMNDEMTISMVSTIRNYISHLIWDHTKSEKIEGHKVRLNWDALP